MTRTQTITAADMLEQLKAVETFLTHVEWNDTASEREAGDILNALRIMIYDANESTKPGEAARNARLR